MKLSAEFFGRTFKLRERIDNSTRQLEFYYPDCEVGIRPEKFCLRFPREINIFQLENTEFLNSENVEVDIDIYMNTDERHRITPVIPFGELKEVLIENFLYITQEYHDGYLPHFSVIMKDFAFAYEKESITVGGNVIPYTGKSGYGGQEYYHYNLYLDNGIQFHLTERGHEPLAGKRFNFIVYADRKTVYENEGPLGAIEQKYKVYLEQKKAERKFLDFVLS